MLNDNKEINQDFIDWACFLSGCDGGNEDADIWLCGIEWGGVTIPYNSTSSN